MALHTLQVAMALNFVIFIAYWVYIIPQTQTILVTGQYDEAFGTNDFTTVYFYIRSILTHTTPYLALWFMTFTADIIYLESDWYLVLLYGIVYTFINFSVC